jgi:hypothetical protein
MEVRQNDRATKVKAVLILAIRKLRCVKEATGIERGIPGEFPR